MTSNYVAAYRAVEDERHNRQNEAQAQNELAEQIRHNYEMEAIQRQGQYLSYSAAIRSAQISANASMAAARTHAQATLQSTRMNTMASRANVAVQSRTQRRVATNRNRVDLLNTQMSNITKLRATKATNRTTLLKSLTDSLGLLPKILVSATSK